MAQNRNLLQTAVKLLETQGRQIRLLTRKVDDTNEQVRALQPQTYLHPIPKPRQGKEFYRSTSVAGWLLTEIDNLNERIPDGGRKYLQFPGEIHSRRLNSDCIRELEGLLSYYIPDLVGEVTWEEACNLRPKDCEQVIREAKNTPELAVFSQAAGQWALRMLCGNKMRTMLATKMSQKAKKESMECDVDSPHDGDDYLVEGANHEVDVSSDHADDRTHMTNASEEVDQIQAHHAPHSVSHSRTLARQRTEPQSSLVDEAENDFVEEEINEHSQENVETVNGDEELMKNFPEIQDDVVEEDDNLLAAQTIQNIPLTSMVTTQHAPEEMDAISPAKIQAKSQRAAHYQLTTSTPPTYMHRRVFEDTVHQEIQDGFASERQNLEKSTTGGDNTRTNTQTRPRQIRASTKPKTANKSQLHVRVQQKGKKTKPAKVVILPEELPSTIPNEVDEEYGDDIDSQKENMATSGQQQQIRTRGDSRLSAARGRNLIGPSNSRVCQTHTNSRTQQSAPLRMQGTARTARKSASLSAKPNTRLIPTTSQQRLKSNGGISQNQQGSRNAVVENGAIKKRGRVARQNPRILRAKQGTNTAPRMR